ncbi:MAG TPA: nitrogen fixation protein FixH [Rhodobacteraceae bacterium]|nr:nitrogen fixation protein FixH [Paracoccaceae bacterium]
MTAAKPREFTGRKMLIVMLSFFGVIISVNVFMAYSAVSTFPGLETDNSYLASQKFNERAIAQRALGWTIEFTHEGDEVVLNLQDSDGAAVMPAAIAATIGRPTFSGEDITLEFHLVGNEYRADADLASGPWRLFLDAVAQDGTPYKKRMHLLVAE